MDAGITLMDSIYSEDSHCVMAGRLRRMLTSIVIKPSKPVSSAYLKNLMQESSAHRYSAPCR